MRTTTKVFLAATAAVIGLMAIGATVPRPPIDLAADERYFNDAMGIAIADPGNITRACSAARTLVHDYDALGKYINAQAAISAQTNLGC